MRSISGQHTAAVHTDTVFGIVSFPMGLASQMRSTSYSISLCLLCLYCYVFSDAGMLTRVKVNESLIHLDCPDALRGGGRRAGASLNTLSRGVPLRRPGERTATHPRCQGPGAEVVVCERFITII